jgi:hypothetical protein
MIHLIIEIQVLVKRHSNKLKAELNGVLFSIDKWNNVLFWLIKNTDGLEWFLERIERAETMILDVM